MAIYTEIMCLAEASPRLAGLLIHRALRPFIDIATRPSVPREALALGQHSTMTLLSFLSLVAGILPEVLDPTEPAPHDARGLPACKRALLSDHC